MNRKNTYNPNLSPAAKRRQLKGKRSPSDFQDFEYRPDMSDYEILQAWEWENARDWTQHLPSTREQEAQAIRREKNKRVQQSGGSNPTNNTTRVGNGTRRAGQQTKQVVDKSVNKATKSSKQRGVAKSGIIGLYSLSVLALIISLVVINLLPLMFLLPLLMVIVLIYKNICRSYINGSRIWAKIQALFWIGINGVGLYYIVLLFFMIFHISGYNYGMPSFDMDTFSVYISGIDTYGEMSQKSRSDVNLVATINPSTGQVLLTTTPRDYYVELPGISKGQKDKLTHAGVYGIDVSMVTLEKLYDTPVNSYIRVNFSSVIDIIDALGGVSVVSEKSFTTSKNAGVVIDIKEGTNHLNGEEALAFVRERYAFADGDAQRGRNQQALFKGLMARVLSPTILVKAHSVLWGIGSNLETDMSVWEMQTFIKSMVKGSLVTEMQTAEAKGTGSKANCYSHSGGPLYVTIPDTSSVNQIQTMMNEIANGRKYYKWSN